MGAVLAPTARTAARCGLGVDPLSPTVETVNAALITPIVATLIRRGLNHVAWLFCSQVRAPVAPVAATIAQAMHTGSVYSRLPCSEPLDDPPLRALYLVYLEADTGQVVHGLAE
jgi:hypothetical protein